MKRIAITFLAAGLFSFASGQFTFERGTNTDSTSVSKLTISGYADTYYSYNFNQPKSNGGNLGTTGAGRVLDIHHNQIVMNLLQTKFSFESKQVQVVLEPVFGPGAELGNFGNSGTSFSVKQAYVGYDFNSKWKLTAGQYGTHIGWEVVDAPINFNYSIDYLMGNGPIYHTGAKLDFTPTDKFGLMFGVVNGWDNLVDNNEGKSLAARMTLTPSDKATIYFNWIGGDEDPSILTGDSIHSYKHMVDLTAPLKITDKFNITLNGAFGWYGYDTLAVINWGGAAVYFDYSFSSKFAMGLRLEYLDDTNGSQNIGASYQGYTLTGIIKAANNHVLFKPEFRLDTSSKEIYFAKTGVSNNQSTLALAVIGVF